MSTNGTEGDCADDMFYFFEKEKQSDNGQPQNNQNNDNIDRAHYIKVKQSMQYSGN